MFDLFIQFAVQHEKVLITALVGCAGIAAFIACWAEIIKMDYWEDE